MIRLMGKNPEDVTEKCEALFLTSSEFAKQIP